MLRASLRLIGTGVLDTLADAGALWRLATASVDRLLLEPFRGERFRLRAAILQTLRAGYNSLPLVMLIAFLMGMIVALQSADQLNRFGVATVIPGLVAVSMTRELAPVVTGIIVAGRFGSAIAAELGTMKVSREIDALIVMGIDPVSFLVVPRILALLISLPCLEMFANLLGILGGLTIGTQVLEFSTTRYLVASLDALRFNDVFSGLAKAAVFAVIIGLVGCNQGLRTHGGAQEVGRATTATVVRSILLIVAADLFVTALFYLKG